MGPSTEGSSSFDPDALFQAWGDGCCSLPQNNNLRCSIIEMFNLPEDDSYIYHATASVTLAQVQSAINHGAGSGLHAWYPDSEGKPLPPPSQSDVKAYTSIFAPYTSPSKVLTGFGANAKKDSIRSECAAYIQSQRLTPPTLTIAKSKKHINLYYDYWVWSCLNLEWAGPKEGTENVRTSHHILPVFMHHFGCAVPSYECLEVIKQYASADKKKERQKRMILEIGSGNGYWSYMLRNMGAAVIAVDNKQSEWRTMWIGDTVISDGQRYLKENMGCRETVLLLVYPIVSAGFTTKVLGAYEGNTVVVAGTQNKNGYTAFKDKTIGDYMLAAKPDFERTVQIPLPSFAGKDDALFVFERKLNMG